MGILDDTETPEKMIKAATAELKARIRRDTTTKPGKFFKGHAMPGVAAVDAAHHSYIADPAARQPAAFGQCRPKRRGEQKICGSNAKGHQPAKKTIV